MVTLKKISISNEEVVYEYYPEVKTEFPGIIIADLIERKVVLKETSIVLKWDVAFLWGLAHKSLNEPYIASKKRPRCRVRSLRHPYIAPRK